MMTSFGTLLRGLFIKRSRSIYLIFVLQLAAAWIIELLSVWSTNFNFNDNMIGDEHIGPATTFFLSWLIIFAVLSAFAEPLCLLITSWQNEKVNRAQSWRLIPIGDSGFYLANILSSLLTFIYLGLLQLLVGLLGSSLLYLFDGHFRAAVSEGWAAGRAMNLPHNWWLQVLSLTALILFAILLWYVMLSFYHFAYNALTDFLPWTNKIWVFLVRLLTLVLVIFLFYRVIVTTAPFFWGFGSDSTLSDLGSALLEILVLSILFGGLNLWLLHDFVEAKQN